MMRYVQDAIDDRPADATGCAAAVVTASWVFHPPGVIRLVTPAEQAAQQHRVPRAEHDATGDGR